MAYLVEQLGDTGILFGRATPPFSVAELVEQVKEIQNDRYPQISLNKPMIVDLRRVRLAEVSSDELREFVSVRRAASARSVASYQAFIVSDPVGFGMVRVFIAHSELRGLRPREKLFVSMNAGDVAAWMADRLAPDAPSAEEILSAIDGLAVANSN